MSLTISGGQTLLFTGDSVTDCGRRDDADGQLGFGYVRAIAGSVAASTVLDGVQIVNTGVGGDRVVDLEARWDVDVLAQRPEVLSVLIGINDTWRRYDSDDPTSVEAFERGYRGILERAAEGGARLVLLEPFLLPVTDAQHGWREDLDPKIAVVHTLAREFDAVLVPTDSTLTALAAGVGAAELAADGVHPTERGHRAIAELWIETVLARA